MNAGKCFRCLAVLFILAIPFSGYCADVKIIAHADVAVSALETGVVQDIFHGKKTSWDDKSKIVPAMLKDGKVHTAFVTGVMGKTVNQFKNFWNQAMFTGKGIPPKSFKTEAELVQFVAANPGAIGYVSSGTSTKGTKVLTVK